jgi:tetratricopeptide (TPR) repeat protein
MLRRARITLFTVGAGDCVPRRGAYTALMADDALARALALKRDGRLDEAVIALETLLAREPRNGFALAHLAHCQLQRGHPSLALEELGRAEAASGTTPFVARLRGETLWKMSKHTEAARSFEEALALGDSGTRSLVGLARCRLRLGDLDAAQEAAGRAVERDPTSSSGWLVLGEVAARRQDDARAEAMFAKAHAHAPTNDYAYAKLIEARLRQLPVEERAREIEVLLGSRGQGNTHLLAVLARVKSELGDEAAAAETWGRSRRLQDDLYAQKMEGYALRRAGDLVGAARVLGDSLIRDPQDVVLFRTYVSLQKQRGAEEELERTLRELLPLAGERRGAVYGELRKLQPK